MDISREPLENVPKHRINHVIMIAPSPVRRTQSYHRTRRQKLIFSKANQDQIATRHTMVIVKFKNHKIQWPFYRESDFQGFYKTSFLAR